MKSLLTAICLLSISLPALANRLTRISEAREALFSVYDQQASLKKQLLTYGCSYIKANNASSYRGSFNNTEACSRIIDSINQKESEANTLEIRLNSLIDEK